MTRRRGSANPWSDLPAAEVILVAGANAGECAPITTDYRWQARERGAKIIVLDPRLTPIARTVHLFIPVRSVCTHLSCAMIDRPDDDVLFCPCSQGAFSSTEGRPIAGPPQRPLPRILIEREGEDLVAVGVAV